MDSHLDTELSSYYDEMCNDPNLLLNNTDPNPEELEDPFETEGPLTLESLSEKIDYIYTKTNQRMIKVATKGLVALQRTSDHQDQIATIETKLETMEIADEEMEARIQALENRLNFGNAPEEGDPFEVDLATIPALVAELEWKKNILVNVTTQITGLITQVTAIQTNLCTENLLVSVEALRTGVEDLITAIRYLMTIFDHDAVLMFVSRGYYVFTVGSKSFCIGNSYSSVSEPCDLDPKVDKVLVDLNGLFQHFKLKLDDVLSRITFFELRQSEP